MSAIGSVLSLTQTGLSQYISFQDLVNSVGNIVFGNITVNHITGNTANFANITAGNIIAGNITGNLANLANVVSLGATIGLDFAGNVTANTTAITANTSTLSNLFGAPTIEAFGLPNIIFSNATGLNPANAANLFYINIPYLGNISNLANSTVTASLTNNTRLAGNNATNAGLLVALQPNIDLANHDIRLYFNSNTLPLLATEVNALNEGQLGGNTAYTLGVNVTPNTA